MLARSPEIVAILAAAGFCLSLVWHVSTRSGGDPGMPWYAFVLFLGVFGVWHPALTLVRRCATGLGALKVQRYAVAGAPKWSIGLFSLSFTYAFANFFFFLLDAPNDAYRDATFGIAASGHAMAFYSGAWTMSWAAARRAQQGLDGVCTNGHPIALSVRACPACDAPPLSDRIGAA